MTESLVSSLRAESLFETYGVHCWNGHCFDLQTRSIYQRQTDPGIIGTFAAFSAITDSPFFCSERFEDRQLVSGTRQFVLDMLRDTDDIGTYFRYRPISPRGERVLNACMYAALIILRACRILGDRTGRASAIEVINWVVSLQDARGAWPYALAPDGRLSWQLDFHQGYVLDALNDASDFCGAPEPWRAAMEKGLAFYRESLFDSQGRAYYRWPRFWPIDIQNQAQGIRTFSLCGDCRDEYRRTASLIAEWTIANMLRRDGRFCYQSWGLVRNRIPYFRWSQASMLEAIACFLWPERDQENH